MRSILSLTLMAIVSADPYQFTFETKVDHSKPAVAENMYEMRYLVDEQYFHKGIVGNLFPIFFYCGNEGDIWGFYKNSGFMTTTLAKENGALVVFAEHRYFGQSWPVPEATAYQPGNNNYLTVENTMADFADLIKMIKVKYNAEDRAVVAFGGSYGGMLAAWMRMKYPAVIQGAIAASAPILHFQGQPGDPEHKYEDIISRDFNETYPD